MKTEEILKYGDSGSLIIELQQMLKILKIYSSSITGLFDKYTLYCVEKYQKENELDVNGEVNYNLYNQLLNKITKTNYSILDKATIKLGSSGEEVIEAQTALTQLMYYSDTIDGIFDDILEISVKQFQYNNNLLSDGIIGKDTWSALIILYKPLNCGETSNFYTVVAGDTLYSISKKFNTTVDEIKRINNLTNDVLSIGQILYFEDISTYTVLSGDTLYSIANKFKMTVNELKSLNNLTSDLLTIGQILKVSNDIETVIYIVKTGDTLYSISKQYNVSVDELKNLNNLINNDIYPGQSLIISGEYIEENIYQVVPGDTLYSIAKKFNTTVDEIKKINNLTSDLLSIGQNLIIS
ncbi:MAG: LysM peptidoglycan-binding domain-containing protein [Mycoplasmatota bacterium]